MIKYLIENSRFNTSLLLTVGSVMIALGAFHSGGVVLALSGLSSFLLEKRQLQICKDSCESVCELKCKQ